jgi:hypothetical protein
MEMRGLDLPCQLKSLETSENDACIKGRSIYYEVLHIRKTKYSSGNRELQ